MGCPSCKFLTEQDRKEGRVNGAVYYCCKLKKYVNCATDSCDNYENVCYRSTYIRNELYKDGKNYYDDATPISIYVIILITLLILSLILNVYNI